MSKNFHEIEQLRKILRVADINITDKDFPQAKSALSMAVKLLNQITMSKTGKESNGKYDKKAEPSRQR